MKGWHMFNKMSMKTKFQEMTAWERELVIRLELDGLLVPHMIEHFLQPLLTVSPLAWKKNSLGSQAPLRIFHLISPRTSSVNVTMTINTT
jgi:hypothetical protein